MTDKGRYKIKGLADDHPAQKAFNEYRKKKEVTGTSPLASPEEEVT